jgi:[protein-PII] uridylyltransferase
MPYRISRLITANGWNIIGARVGQWAGNGAAAFYVQSASRGSITPEEVDMAFAPQQV